jgi:hypothetical protein
MLAVGCGGGGWSYGWFNINSMFGFSLTLQWHGFVRHVHVNSHGGTMLSCNLLFSSSIY